MRRLPFPVFVACRRQRWPRTRGTPDSSSLHNAKGAGSLFHPRFSHYTSSPLPRISFRHRGLIFQNTGRWLTYFSTQLEGPTIRLAFLAVSHPSGHVTSTDQEPNAPPEHSPAWAASHRFPRIRMSARSLGLRTLACILQGTLHHSHAL